MCYCFVIQDPGTKIVTRIDEGIYGRVTTRFRLGVVVKVVRTKKYQGPLPYLLFDLLN